MAILIKTVHSRNRIEFDKGAFDNWCVYLTRPGELRYAPKDTEYFSRLKDLGCQYGHQKIYTDFVAFYTLTDKNINPEILNQISEISKKYIGDVEEIDTWFTVIYAGMVAEENKEHAKLKKRIKRLGMHQVLMEGHNASYAAGFSKGKKWQELDILMRRKGF